jgi:putative acetyltransferase
VKIRLPQGKPDENAIGAVIETAFCEEKNKLIMTLALELARDTTSPSIKSFVAKLNERVIGYVSYSSIYLKSDTGISGYILAPLSVSPQHHKQGVCSELVQRGIDVLTKEGGVMFCSCMMTPLIIDGSDFRKKPGAHSCRHTRWHTRLAGQE